MSRIAAIIPVYNAAATLPRLIESLRLQTMQDFTAIFVDDGSTDDGAGILRGVAARDGRFVVLEGRHAGPGAARNIGLDEADRLDVDFVTFIDSDDFVVPDAFEAAVRSLEDTGSDIVHYPWAEDGDSLASAGPLDTPSIYVWNKVYRRSAVAGVRFLKSDYAEDLAYFLETEVRLPRRIGSPRALYVHVRRPGSLWESRDPKAVCRSMATVIGHVSDVFRRESSSAARVDWKHLYLPKLLKQWKKALVKLPRIDRKKESAVFLAQILALRRTGQFPFLFQSEFRFRMRMLATITAWSVKNAVDRMILRLRSCRFRCRYAARVRSIRNRGERPVKVFFFITEISKWKTRSVYDAMRTSSSYEPVIAVGLDKGETRLPAAEREKILEMRLGWFKERGIDVVAVFDAKSGRTTPFSRFRPDIVFYQQPWQIPDVLSPEKVSRYALTFYVPYCMADFGNLAAECQMPFFREVFGYFVQSRSWAALYRSSTEGASCRFIASGHPIMDSFSAAKRRGEGVKSVIYAPHWTFRCAGRSDLYPYGTFEWNGEEILRYARKHSDWKWVFKPHPLLRRALTERGLMTREEVDAYYGAWERLGVACYDADYPDLFLDSYAMITDSGSFLVEYAATGRPLIHLRPRDPGVEILSPNRRLFSSYYRVSDVPSMLSAFETVLERGEDPAKDARISAASASGVFNVRADVRILRWLDVLSSKRKDIVCKA